MIDTKYQADYNSGRDPDGYDLTLHNFHLQLWNKPLPDSSMFILISNIKRPYRLLHNSALGNFSLSSDSIGHTYRHGKHGKIPEFIDDIPIEDRDDFFALCCTIGGYIVFPSKMVDKKPTINMYRGMNPKIRDRFDLTLECIRRWYVNETNPLQDCLSRYGGFLRLFGDFKGYTEFFLLQDLVDEQAGKINFWLPFEEFGVTAPLPKDEAEYIEYMNNVMKFIGSRNARIDNLKI